MSYIASTKVQKLDFTTDDPIFIESTNNSAGAIYLQANSPGTGGSIQIFNANSTLLNAIFINANAGGILIQADNVMNLTASGVNVNASNTGLNVTAPAVSATTGIKLEQDGEAVLFQVGSGAPSHSAPKGSIYTNTAGSGTNDRLYVATDAVGTWANVTTSS